VEVGELAREFVDGRPTVTQIDGRMQSDLPPLHRAVGEYEEVADLVEFKCCALDAREFQQLSRWSQPGEFEASAGAQVGTQLFGELMLARDPRGVATRLERGNALLPEWRGGKTAKPGANRVKFEHTRG